MVILITGPSFVGKTMLAQKILKKYKYPYLSIDHLKMGLIRSGNTNLTPEDDNQLTRYLWPILKEIIKTVIENRQNLIIEGGYIPLNWRKDFDAQYLAFIRFVCLAMTDKYIDENFEKIKKHSNDLESRQDTTCCTIDKLKQSNHVYIDGCAENKEQIYLIDTDYNQIISEITSKLII